MFQILKSQNYYNNNNNIILFISNIWQTQISQQMSTVNQYSAVHNKQPI